MGIKGLLQALKPIARPIRVSEYRDRVIAVDASCWLHRAAHVCAVELGLDYPSRRWIGLIKRFIQVIQENGVQMIVVFDGAAPPLKSDVRTERRGKRTENMKKALSFLSDGDLSGAGDYFRRSIGVTKLMTRQLQQYLTSVEIPFIVAPYEADAQIAYMYKQGLIAAAVTEDSDLLPFGCKKILTKLDRDGNCLEIDMSRENILKRVLEHDPRRGERLKQYLRKLHQEHAHKMKRKMQEQDEGPQTSGRDDYQSWDRDVGGAEPNHLLHTGKGNDSKQLTHALDRQGDNENGMQVRRSESISKWDIDTPVLLQPKGTSLTRWNVGPNTNHEDAPSDYTNSCNYDPSNNIGNITSHSNNSSHDDFDILSMHLREFGDQTQREAKESREDGEVTAQGSIQEGEDMDDDDVSSRTGNLGRNRGRDRDDEITNTQDVELDFKYNSGWVRESRIGDDDDVDVDNDDDDDDDADDADGDDSSGDNREVMTRSPSLLSVLEGTVDANTDSLFRHRPGADTAHCSGNGNGDNLNHHLTNPLEVFSLSSPSPPPPSASSSLGKRTSLMAKLIKQKSGRAEDKTDNGSNMATSTSPPSKRKRGTGRSSHCTDGNTTSISSTAKKANTASLHPFSKTSSLHTGETLDPFSLLPDAFASPPPRSATKRSTLPSLSPLGMNLPITTPLPFNRSKSRQQGQKHNGFITPAKSYDEVDEICEFTQLDETKLTSGTAQVDIVGKQRGQGPMMKGDTKDSNMDTKHSHGQDIYLCDGMDVSGGNDPFDLMDSDSGSKAKRAGKAAKGEGDWDFIECVFKYSDALFLEMCIMAGCDYLPSLPGIGIKTACKLIRQHGSAESAIEHILRKNRKDPTSTPLSSSKPKSSGLGRSRSSTSINHEPLPSTMYIDFSHDCDDPKTNTSSSDSNSNRSGSFENESQAVSALPGLLDDAPSNEQGESSDSDIDQSYIASFHRARLAYWHSTVYDPIHKQLTHIRPLPPTLLSPFPFVPPLCHHVFPLSNVSLASFSNSLLTSATTSTPSSSVLPLTPYQRSLYAQQHKLYDWADDIVPRSPRSKDQSSASSSTSPPSSATSSSSLTSAPSPSKDDSYMRRRESEYTYRLSFHDHSPLCGLVYNLHFSMLATSTSFLASPSSSSTSSSSSSSLACPGCTTCPYHARLQPHSLAEQISSVDGVDYDSLINGYIEPTQDQRGRILNSEAPTDLDHGVSKPSNSHKALSHCTCVPQDDFCFVGPPLPSSYATLIAKGELNPYDFSLLHPIEEEEIMAIDSFVTRLRTDPLSRLAVLELFRLSQLDAHVKFHASYVLDFTRSSLSMLSQLSPLSPNPQGDPTEPFLLPPSRAPQRINYHPSSLELTGAKRSTSPHSQKIPTMRRGGQNAKYDNELARERQKRMVSLALKSEEIQERKREYSMLGRAGDGVVIGDEIDEDLIGLGVDGESIGSEGEDSDEDDVHFPWATSQGKTKVVRNQDDMTSNDCESDRTSNSTLHNTDRDTFDSNSNASNNSSTKDVSCVGKGRDDGGDDEEDNDEKWLFVELLCSLDGSSVDRSVPQIASRREIGIKEVKGLEGEQAKREKENAAKGSVYVDRKHTETPSPHLTKEGKRSCVNEETLSLSGKRQRIGSIGDSVDADKELLVVSGKKRKLNDGSTNIGDGQLKGKSLLDSSMDDNDNIAAVVVVGGGGGDDVTVSNRSIVTRLNFTEDVTISNHDNHHLTSHESTPISLQNVKHEPRPSQTPRISKPALMLHSLKSSLTVTTSTPSSSLSSSTSSSGSPLRPSAARAHLSSTNDDDKDKSAHFLTTSLPRGGLKLASLAFPGAQTVINLNRVKRSDEDITYDDEPYNNTSTLTTGKSKQTSLLSMSSSSPPSSSAVELDDDGYISVDNPFASAPTTCSPLSTGSRSSQTSSLASRRDNAMTTPPRQTGLRALGHISAASLSEKDAKRVKGSMSLFDTMSRPLTTSASPTKPSILTSMDRKSDTNASGSSKKKHDGVTLDGFTHQSENYDDYDDIMDDYKGDNHPRNNSEKKKPSRRPRPTDAWGKTARHRTTESIK